MADGLLEDDQSVVNEGLLVVQGMKYDPLYVPHLTNWFTSQHREGCVVAGTQISFIQINYLIKKAFSRDGRYIATGSRDASIKVIDVTRLRTAYLYNTIYLSAKLTNYYYN